MIGDHEEIERTAERSSRSWASQLRQAFDEAHEDKMTSKCGE
jgi:hypothetical protein